MLLNQYQLVYTDLAVTKFVFCVLSIVDCFKLYLTLSKDTL